MTNNSNEVLIVGSGFAGLVTAITLRKSDIPLKIFEATESPTSIGGSVTMFPNSMKVLRLIGVADEVVDRGVVIEKVKFQNNFGKHLVYRPQGIKSIYGESTISIRRYKLYEILLNKAKELGIEIFYGKKVVEINENNSYVVLGFEDKSKYTGSILIGCDGINSTVRKHILNQNIMPEYSGLLYVGGFVNKKELIKELNLKSNIQYVSVGPTSWFAYGHIDNTENRSPTLLWFCYLANPKRLSKEELVLLKDKELLNKVLSFHKNWHQPIQKLIENTDELCKANVSDIIEIEKWYKERSIIIGDASHAINPISGQGAGTAMEDGYLLAKLLQKHNNDFKLAFKFIVMLRKKRTTLMGKKARDSSKRTTIPLNKNVVIIRNILFSLVTYFTPEKVLNKFLSYDVEKELEKLE